MSKNKDHKTRKAGRNDSDSDDSNFEVEYDENVVQKVPTRNRHKKTSANETDNTFDPAFDTKESESLRMEKLEDLKPLVPKEVKYAKQVAHYAAYLDTLERLKNCKTEEERRATGMGFLKEWHLMTYLIPESQRLTYLNPTNKRSILNELKDSVDEFVNILSAIDSDRALFEKDCNKRKDATLKIVDPLRFVSWDVGFFLYPYLGRRIKALADVIENELFDVICLQEVNPIGADYLEGRLHSKYKFIYGRKREKHEDFDFTATLLLRDSIREVESKIIYFRNTGEHRSLLRTQVEVGNAKLYILNTHNESTLINSTYRRDQFEKCFKTFQSLPSEAHVILCGSFNTRDWELEKFLRECLHKPITFLDDLDLWIKCAKRNPDLEFDWDLRINKLIQMPDKETPNEYAPSHSQPKKRFSRIYFRDTKLNNLISPISFDFIGKEIVAANKYCISDHFGLVASFSIDSLCYNGTYNKENKICLDIGQSVKSAYEEKKNVLEINQKVKDHWWEDDD